MSTSNSRLGIHLCIEIQGKPWNISKILRGRNSRLGGVFQKEISIPAKTANRPKFLYLVRRNVGLNPDIKISARLFISANYQHSKSAKSQHQSVNLYKMVTRRKSSGDFSKSFSNLLQWSLFTFKSFSVAQDTFHFFITRVLWMRSQDLERFLHMSWYVAKHTICIQFKGRRATYYYQFHSNHMLVFYIYLEPSKLKN